MSAARVSDFLAGWRADRAVAIVAAWLRDEAEFIETEHDGDPDDHRGFIVEHLRWLAASLTRPDHTEEETRS